MLTPAGYFSHDNHEAQPLGQSAACSCDFIRLALLDPLAGCLMLASCVPSPPSQTQKAQILSSRLPSPLASGWVQQWEAPRRVLEEGGEGSLAFVTLALLLSRLRQ